MDEEFAIGEIDALNPEQLLTGGVAVAPLGCSAAEVWRGCSGGWLGGAACGAAWFLAGCGGGVGG